jgi:hypothetical protein
VLRRIPTAAFAAALLACCPSCTEPERRPSIWTCRDYGNARECSTSWLAPSSEEWSCYAEGGDLVCARPSQGVARAGWACSHAGAATICRLPGGATPDEPSPDGWQARVEDDRVVALWRRAGNAPWHCSAGTCTERRPDRPSPDEWECVEGDGRVLCRGRFLVDVDPRWICTKLGDRFLCMDPDPDYAGSGDPSTWRCYYDDSLRTGRACRTAPQTAVIDPDTFCPGAWTGTRCLPFRIAPECWLDGDCSGGRTCRIGLCVSGPVPLGRR